MEDLIGFGIMLAITIFFSVVSERKKKRKEPDTKQPQRQATTARQRQPQQQSRMTPITAAKPHTVENPWETKKYVDVESESVRLSSTIGADGTVDDSWIREGECALDSHHSDNLETYTEAPEHPKKRAQKRGSVNRWRRAVIDSEILGRKYF